MIGSSLFNPSNTVEKLLDRQALQNSQDQLFDDVFDWSRFSRFDVLISHVNLFAPGVYTLFGRGNGADVSTHDARRVLCSTAAAVSGVAVDAAAGIVLTDTVETAVNDMALELRFWSADPSSDAVWIKGAIWFIQDGGTVCETNTILGRCTDGGVDKADGFKLRSSVAQTTVGGFIDMWGFK
jgi:hypothetical protein